MKIKVSKRWLLGGGVLVGALLLLSKRRDPQADLNALTRMLIAETDFTRDKNEMAQIVLVAVNRADKYGENIKDVVKPPGIPVSWNAGATYKQRYWSAQSSPRWSKALQFVQEVLAGKYPNRDYTAFVHPSGSAVPPCTRTGFTTAQTIAGARCIPTWAVKGQVVGEAMFV